jgi:hypothetical protein
MQEPRVPKNIATGYKRYEQLTNLHWLTDFQQKSSIPRRFAAGIFITILFSIIIFIV